MNIEKFNPMERRQNQENQENTAEEFTLEAAQKLTAPESIEKLKKLAGDAGYICSIDVDQNSGIELDNTGDGHLGVVVGPFSGTPSHSEESPRIIFNLDEASPEDIVENFRKLKHGDVIARDLLSLLDYI